MNIELKAGQNDNGRRLDRILRKALPDHPLSLLHRLLRQGKVKVNKKKAAADTVISAGDSIKIYAELNVNQKKSKVNDTEVETELPEILWRGSGVIVFNKPAGLAVHGPESLDARVKNWLEGQRSPSLSFRPGPLHRLDKPTSGAVAFSETLEGAKLFSSLLRDCLIEKTYLAIVQGRLETRQTWNDMLIRDKNQRMTQTVSDARSGKSVNDAVPINAKDALTIVLPLACNGVYSLVKVQIKTGRTHQIRAQAAAHDHPLAGDVKYGGSKLEGHRQKGSFFLHAWKLEFNDASGAFPRAITAPPPDAFLSQVKKLFGQNYILK
jgi:23S rRNA pseudouridine955/2504/2580 synthase